MPHGISTHIPSECTDCMLCVTAEGAGEFRGAYGYWPLVLCCNEHTLLYLDKKQWAKRQIKQTQSLTIKHFPCTYM